MKVSSTHRPELLLRLASLGLRLLGRRLAAVIATRLVALRGATALLCDLRRHCGCVVRVVVRIWLGLRLRGWNQNISVLECVQS